ncbi:uncharacterized protein LOC105424014 [Pogonomyrmex barbatus]|uniref:Uncharacterized protein LOC105424014 n=1 Tax=Pogonomyrmex barbatus TaxID=144034 RepID=A0A6I9VYS4_9HYME|nr:uncharacterized protein LOC105424014 [Pogonomyrmex barbatus]
MLSILPIVEFIPRKLSPDYVTTSCFLSRVPFSSIPSHCSQTTRPFGISLSGFLDEQTLDKIATSTGEKLHCDTRLCTAFGVWMEFAPTRNNLFLYYLLLHLGKRSHPELPPRAVEEGTSNETYARVDNLNLRHVLPRNSAIISNQANERNILGE